MKRNRDCSLGAGVPMQRPATEGASEPTRVHHPRKTTIPFFNRLCYSVFAIEVEHGTNLEKLDRFAPAHPRGRASAQQRHPAGGKHVQDELDSQFPVAVCLKMRTFVVGTAPQSLSGFRIDRSRTRLNMRGQVLI